ncbi:ABC transporter permease [Bacteroidota bacterium]
MSEEQSKILEPRLPGFFLGLLRWYCNSDKLEEIEGDLEELYFINTEKLGVRKARIHFAWNVIRCCKPYAWKRKIELSTYYFNFIMILNYLKIAHRNLLKHKTFSLINIFGLSFSMSVCLLIITIINDQLSRDNFHENGDRIYRVITDVQEKEHDGIFLYASTAMPVAGALKNDYTGIEEVVRITKSLNGDGKAGEKIIPVYGLFADQSFLEVFSFKLKDGDPETALKDPFSVILSEETAQIFFGDNNPVGETIEIGDKGVYTITGIVDDPPGKSHIKYELIGSVSTLSILEKDNIIKNKVVGEWGNPYASYVYVLLEEGVDPELINNNLLEISNHHADVAERFISKFQLQKLSSITPSPVMNNMFSQSLPMEVIVFLGFLTVIVMLSACFNYTNLSISRALTRAKEVGIRKVTGAMRWQIITQFLSESVLFSTISLALALFIHKYLLGVFNQMSVAREVSLHFEENTNTYLWFIAFSMLVGIIAGLIPAIFLSSFKPIIVLKKMSGIKLFSKLTLRKSLVVLQFTVSLFFIITAIIITKQSGLLVNSEYGFTKENIVNIKLQDADADQFLNEITKRIDVIQASACSHIPATGSSWGERMRREAEDEKIRVDFFYVDQNYIDNLDLHLVAGSNFPENASRGNEQFMILNEKAVEDLKFSNPHEAIGEEVLLGDNDTTLIQVIGVVRNYNFRILLMDISPMALRYSPGSFQYANVKIKSNDIESTIAGLENEWRKFDQVHVFDYQFFDEQLEETLGFVKDLKGIIGITAILAIIIASLGLLGMAIYNTESRVKEIGIRKVMGADISSIIILLSKGFVLLIGISIILATPLAYFVNSLWLREIATRITIGPGILTAGITILLGLGILTIGSQSVRAAFANPAASLKDE